MSKFVVAAMLAWLAAIQPVAAAELRTLRYGIGLEQGGTGAAQDQSGLGALPYVVGQRQGLFEHEGIDLQFVHYKPRPPLGNQDTLFDALGKGEFDMTRSQLSFFILHVLKGADFAAVAGNTANQLQTLMARPEIKDFADLKGKTVALTWPYDLITLSTLKLMDQHGIKKDDVHVSVITGSGPRAKCLQSGDCAAVALSDPYDRMMEAQGFRALGNSHENPSIPFIVEVVDKTWAQANEATVVGYIRALAAAMRMINDPQNIGEIAPIVSELTKGSDATSRALLTKYYYDSSHPYLPRQAELDVDGLGRVLGLMAEYDQIPKPAPPTSRFVDLRYAHAAGVQ
jgi:ABC-type nitrate/sulfonate/bicarbonate transport system substrate-binding protein